MYIYDEKLTSGGCLPLPWIYVYEHYIQTSIPQKLLGQSSLIQYVPPMGRGTKIYINCSGHLSKTAATPIYMYGKSVNQGPEVYKVYILKVKSNFTLFSSEYINTRSDLKQMEHCH